MQRFIVSEKTKKVVLKMPFLMLLAVAEMQRLQMMKKLGSSILHVKSLLILAMLLRYGPEHY